LREDNPADFACGNNFRSKEYGICDSHSRAGKYFFVGGDHAAPLDNRRRLTYRHIALTHLAYVFPHGI
jgi:hypothetical protein